MSPVNKISEHNKKHNLQFEEKEHKYTIEGDIVLKSVTTKLQSFFPFDAIKVANELALQRGVDPKSILDEWDTIRDNGTATHNLAERFCNGEELTNEELNKVKHVSTFLKCYSHFQVLGSEVRIFSKKYKVAGTIDLVLKNKTNNRIYLLDWKTSSKEIERDKYWDMAQGKLSNLPHNKFHQYSMQLAVYSKIIKEEYDITVFDGLLVHLREDQTFNAIEPADLLKFADDVLSN
ncbi:MAG: PD-(D/E)XK nuclease family protein [Candidatus Woesearchaeota archaeon]|jgi:ATP-dependent exoDNAse (exonuclease V) beta subunit|nr:PD-(D/E)XK nuclease family protein [Candidatus Woesearchaeota archaeon]